jgi:DNA-binding transcriptional MerR regulator
MELSCTIHEFAERNGVTVRALQHYDRLGLLCPRRSPVGYRRYSKADAGRLRQIHALQWVGLSLKEIGRLLNDESADVAGALTRRRTQLEEQRQRLDSAIAAIRQAGLISPEQREQILNVIGLNRAVATHNPDSQLSRRIAEARRGRKGEFARSHSSEEIEQMKKESADLFRDAAAAVGMDPTSPEAQSIVTRYRQMMAKQCNGNPEQLAAALDLHRWFPVFPAGLGLESKLENFSDNAWVFLGKALAASEQESDQPSM